ncbi:hypothetical protein [Desmospora activa]|uniref:hypothetical protein n=1 Tax=Desmospora activa TaxID=500615 RepID=UPI000D31B863|nr:hypothetical protein [Desmospora activa]
MKEINLTININNIKIVSMSTASTVAIGNSGIANRNTSKSNAGPSPVVGGDAYVPIQKQITYDPDNMDTPEWGGDHVINAPGACPPPDRRQ